MLPLPEIKMNYHARAKRLSLRVDSKNVRLTVPLGCTQRQIQEFLQQSEAWLIQTWQAQQEKITVIDQTLPKTLKLFNLAQKIQIHYQIQKKAYQYNASSNLLTISNREPSKYLKQFVFDYAKAHLPTYLTVVSNQCHLPFQQSLVKAVKTRWGSCSSRHSIMLNAALVLHKKAIVRYVCVHELAHTIHFNHSADFWSLVEKLDSSYPQHRQQLKTTALPWWWQS